MPLPERRDGVQERLKAALAGLVILGDLPAGPVAAEHQAEQRRLLRRKGDIALPHENDLFDAAERMGLRGGAHERLQAVEATTGKGLEQGAAIREMPVGRRRADPGHAAGIGQGKAVRALFSQQPMSRVDQGLAQVAVVVTLLGRRLARLGGGLAGHRAGLHRNRLFTEIAGDRMERS